MMLISSKLFQVEKQLNVLNLIFIHYLLFCLLKIFDCFSDTIKIFKKISCFFLYHLQMIENS